MLKRTTVGILFVALLIAFVPAGPTLAGCNFTCYWNEVEGEGCHEFPESVVSNMAWCYLVTKCFPRWCYTTCRGEYCLWV